MRVVSLCMTTPFFRMLLCLLLLPAAALRADDKPPRNMEATPLIPRRTFFGNPDKSSPQISPDGTKLAFLAAVDGVLNVYVGPIDNPVAARPVTQDRKRGIRSYQWAFDNEHILYIQDKNGDENWHVYASSLKTTDTKDLTPLNEIQARIQEVSHKIPGDVLIAINDRDKAFHDIYR